MKIELTYDPVKPETLVSIDGQMTDKTDIYGFLYPVRHCLLQTWLYPTGSWSGLGWQLRELSRGEDMELTFRGCPEDYADLRDALAEMENLTLSFCKADPLSRYAMLFSDMEDQVMSLLDDKKNDTQKKTIRDLFPETAEQITELLEEPDSRWLRVVATQKQLAVADRSELCCCMVLEEYLDSYEKLDNLIGLTRSMRRSQDMIFCCIEDPEKRKEFAHYAAQVGYGRLRFGTQAQCAGALAEKYGQPFEIRARYEQFRAILELLGQLYAQRSVLSARKKTLSLEKNLKIPQIRELERSKIILNWFDRKEPYLIKLAELLQVRNPLRYAGKE